MKPTTCDTCWWRIRFTARGEQNHYCLNPDASTWLIHEEDVETHTCGKYKPGRKHRLFGLHQDAKKQASRGRSIVTVPSAHL